MKCRACGQDIQESDKFCQFCGTPVIIGPVNTVITKPVSIAKSANGFSIAGDLDGGSSTGRVVPPEKSAAISQIHLCAAGDLSGQKADAEFSNSKKKPVQSIPTASVRSEKTLCQKCGAATASSKAFCSYCGAKLLNARRKLLINAESTNMRIQKMAAIAAITTACVAVVVMFLLFSQTNPTTPVLTERTAQRYLDDMLDTVFQEASSDNYVAQILKEKTSIKLDKLEDADGYMLATCTVTSVNIEEAIIQYFETLAENTNADFSSVETNLVLAIQGALPIQQTFYVKFILKNDKYVARIPEEMSAFCSGNIQKLLPKIYDTLQGG